MKHRIKIQHEYYTNIRRGVKKVEIRLNDRDYQKGDLIEFLMLNGTTVREGLFEITHVHSGLGMEHGYVALSIIEHKGETE